MKILIADDHALFRAGLRLLLAGMEPSATLLEAESLAQVAAAAEQHPDLSLCLLDLAFEGEDRLDALSTIKHALPEVAVVVVSATHDAATVRACLDHGAMSFVPKSMPAATLSVALTRVLAGEIYLPEEVTLGMSALRARPNLTPRQIDVLRGLSRGLPTKSIARELKISEHTVKEYISLVFDALGVHNRTEAVITAARLGLPPMLPRRGNGAAGMPQPAD